MAKYTRNVRAAWEALREAAKKFRKNFERDLIGILGSALLLIFICIAGFIFWISDKYKQIRTGRA